MEPFFFGPSHRRLFGFLSPSHRGPSPGGVVLCPPLGQEAIRSHRSLRLLSEQLSQAGLNALRFDYSGTGDSGGDLLSARPGDWLEDIRLAAQELRERASVTRLVIVGLRFGGFLAAAAEVRAVGSLILWDPVTHPGQYLERARSQGREDGSRGLDWQGFYFPTELLDELADLSLEDVRRIPRDVKIIVSDDTPGLPSFERELEAKRARVEVIRLDAPQAWFEEEELGAGAVPVDVLRQIKEWVV